MASFDCPVLLRVWLSQSTIKTRPFNEMELESTVHQILLTLPNISITWLINAVRLLKGLAKKRYGGRPARVERR